MIGLKDSQLIERIRTSRRFEVTGRVTQVVGLVIESNGPNGKIGDLCEIEPAGGGAPVPAEVVGFRNDRLVLMPIGETHGVRSGCRVRERSGGFRVPVGHGLLGRTIDGLGQPLDGLGPLAPEDEYPVQAEPPSALARQPISRSYSTGVRAIDGLLTMGVGQRIGIFAGSGVGKSTLLGMIARHGQAQVNVIALVGERGREVREFIERDLGPEGLERSVVVCATSDQPALVRIKAAQTATAIAEWFRDQGQDVLLMMDSVTRFAMAQREVGLAVGEPPSSRGYTPSVFAMLPKLMERAGCGRTGAITAIYTVLVDGDDTNEPIADATRAILDGHIVLSRSLVSRGHYPPIDVLGSLSRVMPLVADADHVSDANKMRELVAAYRDVEDLLSIGAYKEGARPISDRAIARWPLIEGFLRQDRDEGSRLADARRTLAEIVHG